MKFAFQFPMRAVNRWDDWVAGHSIGELAAAAEDAGFDMISSTDHPFPDEKWLSSGGHHAFDPFVSLAFMAAPTTRIRLLTMLVVAGYRHPYKRDIEGNVAAIGGGLSCYAAAGVTQLLVESRARSFGDCLRELELYRTVISAA
jgi:hypothetical protein